MAVDYINTLGAGAGFNTKELVTALVNAEKAPKESSINNRITESEAKISALASAVSNLNTLSASAKALNDRSDFQSFTASNSQITAFSVSTDANAEPGSHSVTVSSVAREQRTNLSQHGGSDFTGKTQLLNSGSAFSLAIEIGDSSTVTHTVNVTTTTPQGIVDAINAAGLDVTASLMDKGTAGTNYIIQLTGKSVAGIDPDSGAVLWRADREGKTAVISTPIVQENTVFVTSGYGIGCNAFRVTKDGTNWQAEQLYANKEIMNHHGFQVYFWRKAPGKV